MAQAPPPMLDEATVAEIASAAAAGAAAAEKERHLPAELVEQMRGSGLFAAFVPADLGGPELHPVPVLTALEAIAAADGSAGWIAMIGATTSITSGWLGPDAASQVFAAGNLGAGVFAPKGTAAPAGDGYRVQGRWSFGSGSPHADWLMAGCRIASGEGWKQTQGGRPDVLAVWVPADTAQIHDTWHVAGLRATASHDFELDADVPRAYSFSFLTGAPWPDGPLYRFPPFGLLALGVGAVALGIARGACDDLTQVAGTKKASGSARPLAERATVQAAYARAESRRRAAWAYLLEATDRAWEEAEDGGIAAAGKASLRMAAAHAAWEAAAITGDMFAAAGSGAVYEDSSLQRRWRDAHVARQHMMVAEGAFELTGRVLLDVPTDSDQL